MPSIEEIKRDLMVIVSRNIIFPEDQLRILHLIKDGHLVCNSGNFSLKMIEDRNLIFPQDVMTLRNLVHTINSGDGNFKCLLEMFIAAFQNGAGHNPEVIEKDGVKYYKDPVTYTETDTVDGVTFHVKKRPEYKNIYQEELFLDQSGTLLSQLCRIASFRSNVSTDYGLRVYFNAEMLKVTPVKQIRTTAAEVPKETESKDEYDILTNKINIKITKCGNEYLDQWNALFERNSTAEIAYSLLNVLKDKPHIEIVKIDAKGRENELPTLIEAHVKDDSRIINKTKKDVEKETVVDSFLGFLRNMVGGGNLQIDHREYTEMKNRYKYEKAKLIHQLLN
jgi:hypothetical protein